MKKQEKLRVKFCPNCGSKEIKMFAGGNVGIYECKKCGFRSSIFPEIELENEINKEKKK